MAFRIEDGRTLTGELAWATHTGIGTMKKREKALLVGGTYPLAWSDYSDLGVPAGRFRHLVIPVTVDQSDNGPPRESQPDADLVARRDEVVTDDQSVGTCRAEVRASVRRAARRDGGRNGR